MKMQSLNHLAPCMVAAAGGVGRSLGCSQEVQHMESMPIEGSGFVGDMSCSSCGSTVSEDGGLLRGQCPNCGGSAGGPGRCLTGPAGRSTRRLFGTAACSGVAEIGEVDRQIHERGYGRPDLFYNYYTQGFANRANAQMYLAPSPGSAKCRPHVLHLSAVLPASHACIPTSTSTIGTTIAVAG